MAPTSSKQHGVNVGVNASATPFQQASGYGSHGYSTGETINYLKGMFGGGHAGPAHFNEHLTDFSTFISNFLFGAYFL